MTIKHSYQEWKQCIFDENKQPFTKDFIEQRLSALQDEQHTEHKKFVSTYGAEYTKQIISYFERALGEAK